MRSPLAGFLFLAACGGGESLPTPEHLYGNWSAHEGGVSRLFQFYGSPPPTHPELEGFTDVYVLTTREDGETANVIASGQFAIDRVPLAELDGAEDDAIVTIIASGPGAGSTVASRIIEWVQQTSLTISDPLSSTGQLTFEPRLL